MKYYKLLFPILVLICLIVPLFHINMAGITEQENRTLAEFPSMKKEDKLNRNYSKEFEAWLGDRFWGRNQLIGARFKILYALNGRIENEAAFVGDDGWMFEKPKILNVPPIKRQKIKIKEQSKVLKKFVDKFKKKNVLIYLLVIPNRELLYQKYWERYYKPRARLNYAKELQQEMKEFSNVFVVDPWFVIQKNADKELMYWKDDQHLTPAGMNLLLKRLYRYLAQNELKDISAPLEKEKKLSTYRHTVDIGARLGFKSPVNIPYNYKRIFWNGIEYQETEHKKSNKVKEDKLWGNVDTIYREGYSKSPLISKKLFILAPCYGNDVYDFLKPLYKTSSWIRTQLFKHHLETREYVKKKIEEISDVNDPSTIILIVSETFFPEILKDIVK